MMLERSAGTRFGIRAQVLCLVLVPLACLLTVFILTTTLRVRAEAAASASRHAADVLAAAAQVSLTVGQGSASLTTFGRTHDPAELAGYADALNALPKRIDTLRTLVGYQPEESRLAERFLAVVAAIVPGWAHYAALLHAGRWAEAQALASSPDARSFVIDVQSTRADLDRVERQQLLVHFTDLQRTQRRLGTALLAVSALGTLLSVALAMLFGFQFVRRVNQLALNARRLAAGEQTEPLLGGDELAALDALYRVLARRVTEQHAVASTLQHALLPQTFPRISGLRIDSTYLPATQGAEIGGDWYDVFELPNRQVGISIGDVAGHGMRAATIMGTMRQSIRMAARFTTDPALVMRFVNRTVCAEESGTVVTAFFGVLDMRDGGLQYALAGHAPPLLVRPSGDTAFLPGKGMMLGFDERTQFENFSIRLDVGYGLVLFTDGVVEIERDYFQGLYDLEQAAIFESFAPSANIAEGIRARAMRGLPPRDDAAVLFLGVTSVGAALAQQQRWTFDAVDEAAARRMKRAVLWQLAGTASSSEEFGDVEAILGELLSNVARHSPGQATVTMEQRGDELVLHVEDRGRPFSVDQAAPDPLAESGRGLLIVQALAREVQVVHTAVGNRISAVLPLPASA
jgi:serine phosphatase RsbU (regulator of sigma subunit)/anti-sigma regulatory factor (Ser/Thr protein kinase)/CHASE3 domain sensor protein